MQTSCPACQTTFRVSQDQLGLRRGLVRCGQCNAVFNAYDTLLPELAEPPADSLPEIQAAELEPHTTGVTVETAEPVAIEPQPGAAEAYAAVSGAELSPADRAEETAWGGVDAPLSAAGEGGAEAATASDVEAVSESVPPAQWLLAEPATASESSQPASRDAPVRARDFSESAEAILLAELPNRLHAARSKLPLWQRSLYVLTVLGLLLALLAQLMYFLRAELVVWLPASRPALSAYCRALNCVVPLPQQLVRSAITASSLEHDPEQKSRIRLNVLLANRFSQAQTWPHLILTLSDVRETPVAQRAFAPSEYLPSGVQGDEGFPAESEQEVSLELDIGNLVAASYVLDLKYP